QGVWKSPPERSAAEPVASPGQGGAWDGQGETHRAGAGRAREGWGEHAGHGARSREAGLGSAAVRGYGSRSVTLAISMSRTIHTTTGREDTSGDGAFEHEVSSSPRGLRRVRRLGRA